MSNSKTLQQVKELVHIVNVVNFQVDSEHAIAQSITLETLRRAKKYASDNGLKVRLLSAQFPEDIPKVPDWLETTEPLNSSSLDHPNFLDKRKLPYLSDILNRAIDNARNADAIIYSNIDISVQKEIYLHIKKELEEGNNSLSITRRTISKDFNSIEQIEAMYSSEGNAHPGDDFFVISRSYLDKLHIKPVFVGVSWFDKILYLNLAAYCRPFKKIKEKKWTFHIGNDLSWQNSKSRTISEYNKKHLIDLISEIEEKQGYSPHNKDFWPYVCSIYRILGFEIKISLGDTILSYARKAKRKLVVLVTPQKEKG